MRMGSVENHELLDQIAGIWSLILRRSPRFTVAPAMVRLDVDRRPSAVTGTPPSGGKPAHLLRFLIMFREDPLYPDPKWFQWFR